MSIGDSTNFSSPLLVADNVGGGLYEDVPIEVLARRRKSFFFLDFILPDDLAAFTVTNITSGTATINPTAANGVLHLSCDVLNQGLASVQYTAGAGAYLESPEVSGEEVLPISYCVRARLMDWANCDWYIGLAYPDTGLMAANGTLGATGGGHQVGFHHLLADGNDVRLTAESGAVGTNPAVLLSQARVPKPATAHPTGQFDARNHEFGIRITSSSRVNFYLDGVYRHTTTLAAPYSGSWTPSFALIANGDAVTLDVDYLWSNQHRGHSDI